MNLGADALDIIMSATEYAGKNHQEYVTPETVLLIICDEETVSAVLKELGADLESLKSNLSSYLEEYVESGSGDEPVYTDSFEEMIQKAIISAYSSGKEEVGITHILHGMWQLKESFAIYYMEQQGIVEADLLRMMADLEDERELQDDPEDTVPYGAEQINFKSFAPCLNDTADRENPLIGREDELERTIQILCRRDKNNPLHIGEPGVGKTAITIGLVQRINRGEVPDELKGSKVYALDLCGILAGSQYRGDFEKRIKKVFGELEKEEKPIVYIDEIHTLSGAGAVGESSFDAANMLKPYMAAGHIRFIGATTYDEYKKYFEKNKSLARRFQNIDIKEPDIPDTLKIINGLRERYESFHGVKYSDEAIEYAVNAAAKHINDRFLPDKAIDLIDEAGAYKKINAADGKEKTVEKDDIGVVLTKICRVPIETVKTDESEGLEKLEDKLKEKIFGQDEALSQAVNAIKFSKAGLLEDGKPLASLLFVGPTGVGKTEVARSLAEQLGVKLIRFDMSEYGEKHTVAKLIGAPAGYVGYEEGGLLTDAVRKNPFAVLLLDEIEKAHSDIYNILLQVMDYATLTDNQGRKADFRNVVLIMTSNAGASRIGKKNIGFGGISFDSTVIMDEVKRTFQPEFRNRLNRIVIFNAMDDDMAERIVGKKLGELAELLGRKNIVLSVADAAKAAVKEKGTSAEFGAREIDRVIRNEIKPLFVDDILFGNLKNGGRVKLDFSDEKFTKSY